MGANYNRRSARNAENADRCAVHNVWCFMFSYFTKLQSLQILGYEAHFRAESIGASPVIVAFKTGKLFSFFY